MCIIDCLGIRFFAIARVVVIRRRGVVLSIFYSQAMTSALSHDHNDPCVRGHALPWAEERQFCFHVVSKLEHSMHDLMVNCVIDM